MKLPDHITKRLTQRTPTPYIVQESTPVLGFGNFLAARIATLGLNPSKNEFLRRGVLLEPPHNSLETLQTLGLRSLAAATARDHERILNSCLSYFNTGNSYHWFSRLAPLLSQLDVSYAAGTACHLDLVQTATDPIWSRPELAPHKQQYLEDEIWFLREQLENHQIETLLLNGRSVVRAVEAKFRVTATWTRHQSTCGRPFEFYSGTLALPRSARTIQVRGWNLNIQSSHGVTTALVSIIGELCHDQGVVNQAL